MPDLGAAIKRMGVMKIDSNYPQELDKAKEMLKRTGKKLKDYARLSRVKKDKK